MTSFEPAHATSRLLSGPTGAPRRAQNQPAAPTAAPAPAPQTPADQIQVRPLGGPTPTQPIVSHLQVQIEDKDGLANFGQNDVKATVSGDVAISAQFLLDKLGEIKSDKEKKFYKPEFDAERKQYVISGKAINKILGLIDIGFEIRLGAVDGKLAFRVDSGIKRGSIYEDLTKMLKEQGLTTYEKDGLLYIKPEYKQTIKLPALGDQPARIEKIGATADNIRFEIGQDGQIKIQLKAVPLELSSQTGTTNARKATPDTAFFKVDLGFDKTLAPTARILDGRVNARAGSAEIEKYLGEGGELLSEQLGTALSVGLTGLRGQIQSSKQGLVLNTSGQVSVRNADGSAQVSAGVKAELKNGSPVISASQADVRLKDGTAVTAGRIAYDGRKEGLNIDVDDLDGRVKRDGIDVGVTDLSGNVSRSEAGTLKARLTGQTRGTVSQDGVKADFATSGEHSVSLKGQFIRAEVDQAEVTGSYEAAAKPATRPAEGKPAEQKKINLSVKQVSASGTVSLPGTKIEAGASQGSLQVDIGQGVSVKTTARVKISAQGEKVQGQAHLPQGADLAIDRDGAVNVRLDDAQLEGKFDNPGKLKVDGKVTGDVAVHVNKEGRIGVTAEGGNFDANFALKDKVKVKGKGESVDFAIDKQENISLDLGNTQATTDVTAGKTRLNAKTTGQRAQVSVINDDVTVQTTGTKSTLNINVNQILQGSGTAGDVTVKVDSDAKGDDIKITARQADVKAKIQNKKGNLRVGVDAQAQVDVHVDPKENVTVSSRQARSKVDFQLVSPDGKQEKIKVKATGSDFRVSVQDDSNVGVELKQAGFSGKITPNEDMTVDVASTTPSSIKVNVDEGETDTRVAIRSGSAVKGTFGIENKIHAEFRNPTGFEVDVTDKPKGTDVRTRLKGLELLGSVKTPEAKVGVDGKGDLDLQIIDDEDVKVLFDGHLLGNLQAGDEVAGRYGLTGKVKVDVKGSDVDVSTRGSLQTRLNSPAHGVGADVLVNGQSEPIRVQVKNNQVSVKVQEGGQIEVRDLKKLKLGKPDPKLDEILGKIESNHLGISYRNLDIRNQGASGSVQLRTDALKTVYGAVETEIQLEKHGEHVYVDKGFVAFAPNLKFYQTIQQQINDKYNIKISGTPSFENGEIKIQGELRSNLGLVQWADFSIKARVVDNKLVFDLEKAHVLKVIGKGTIGDAAKALLSKTDIDFFRKGPGTIEIELADIVKDLALTEGVNFTDLKLVDNRFEVGFRYNSHDLEIARLAKKNDVAGLKRYLAAQPLSALSGESISTTYNTYLEAKDTPAATRLLINTLRAYEQSKASTQLDRALVWMTKSQVASKQDVNDDIALSVLKELRLGTPAAKTLVEDLPVEVVKNLADSLDKTISQGGGFSWITTEERDLANQLRRLKGLPENKRII